MGDYTPSTDEVREAWRDEMFPNASDAAFDRMIATVRADHEQAVRERIVRDIEVAMRRHDRAQVGFSAIGDAYADAARIVREGA